MKVKLGSLSVDIRRNRDNKTRSASLDDVKSINYDHFRYLHGLGENELQSRVKSVSVRSLCDTDRVRTCLREHGIVAIPDFIDSSIAKTFNEVISDLKTITGDFLKKGLRVDEQEEILLQKGAEKLSGYEELSSYHKTVFQVREGQDNGMVDVFNVDIAFPEAKILRKAYEDSNLKKIFSSSGLSVSFRNLNVYLNKSVTSTRGFHVDSYSGQLKAFIYLTDCLALGDGPYTYVKGSHKETPYRRLNQEICANLPSKTETPLLNRDDIVPILAGRGSLIISDQSGFHRGFPQENGHERVISVINIK